MATQKSRTSTNGKPAKSSRRRRILKTAAVVAAVGVATLAVAKGLKTRRGRALKKKVVVKSRKALRRIKSAVT